MSTFDTTGPNGGEPLDVNVLASLANRLFSALPDESAGVPGLQASEGFEGRHAGGHGVSGLRGVEPDTPRSSSPAVPEPFSSGLPRSRSAPDGFGLPTKAQLLDRLDPRSLLHLVPSANAPTPKGVDPLHLTGYPSRAPDLATRIPASHGSDLLGIGAAPAGFGLPTDAQLLALLAPTEFGASIAPGQDSAPYYFLDQSRSRSVEIHVPGQGLGAPPEQGRSAIRTAPFDINLVRRDFPILAERVNGRQLIWLDNAATTQKPQCVIDRLVHFYQHENSNIHRAAHELAARATDAYEGAREKVRGFLNAASPKEIVFVRGATEAINLVAQSWGRQHIGKDDEIIISWLEHHANIVPWQQLCAEKGAILKVIPVDDDGQILLDEYARLLGPRTRLVSFTQVSNALGTITPAQTMVQMAHAVGARVLVDGAQAVSHLRADVSALDCDWYVFSGHKVFGPTGIGVLYGKEALLNDTQPWQGGGNMIRDVTFEHTEYHQAPGRFEAGTGNIADAVGLGAAIDYVQQIGIDNINRYEHQLLAYATGLLRSIPGLRLIGTAPDKASVLSFVLEGCSNEEVGAALSREGIAVRSGHHCAQPILRRFGLESSVRPSLAFYNNCADVDALVGAVRRINRTRHLAPR